MTQTTQEKKLARALRRIELLEDIIETKTREVYQAHRELQVAHRNLTELHRVLPSALMVVNSDDTISTVNRATLELLGYTAPELIGRPLAEVCTSVASRLDTLRAADETPTAAEECSWQTSDGTYVPVLVSLCVQRDQQNDDKADIVLVGGDLREQKQLEIELRHAQKLESIGQLAAGIAHEINTPMQFIGDNVHFLSEAFEDVLRLIDAYDDALGSPEVPAHLKNKVLEACEEADLDYLQGRMPRAFERTLTGVQRVSTIVAAMKAFSHPQNNRGPVNINKAIETTLTVARSEYKDLADVETDLQPVPTILGYGGDLNQVLLNLIVNAAHAIDAAKTPENGRGRIGITTRQGSDHIEIEIADTGTGIPVDIQNRIFEPFFTTKEVGKGTGQGLSLAHSIVVDKHGGSLTFKTELGAGTTFVVRLPVELSAAGQEKAA